LKKYIISTIIISIVIFSLGVSVGTYKIFPYQELNELKKILLSEDENEVTNYSMNKFIYDIDVSSLIRITEPVDIDNKKDKLINYIWNTEFPSVLPTNIEYDIFDTQYDSMDNLEKIDKIEYEMEFGINSISYLFFPTESNNKLIIYHEGHAGDFLEGKKTIEFFLKNGYTVEAFSMPLLGMNSKPIVETENFGTIILNSHNHLKYVESDNLKPIKFFFEPIAASVNYLKNNYTFDDYYMVGISGGAWTTMYYSAMDDRIIQSFSVAGPYPLYIRSNYNQIGDYETELPEFIAITNELESYIMSSYGENRKFVQIYNQFDSCCFDGDFFKTYENVLKEKMKQLGKGTYDVYLDDTHYQHIISDYSLDVILDSMKN